MGFDVAKFEQARLEARTQKVLVPGLAAFFSDGEEAAFTVRSLTSSELHRASEAKQRQQTMRTVLEALADNKEKAAELRKALGLDGEATPGEIAKRQQMLVAGCVSPVITETAAVRISEAFPIEFLELTNVITELTGKGYELVKPSAVSQKTTASITQ